MPIQVSAKPANTISQALAYRSLATETFSVTPNFRKSENSTALTNFCPKCQAFLGLAARKSAEIYCRKCHYKIEHNNNRVLKKKINPSRANCSEIAVVDKQISKLRTFPVVHAICSECNNDKSETWIMAFGSEGTTGITFLRCTLCGHTWREAE